MPKETFMPVAKGLIKKILQHQPYSTSTSGTDQARYCYSVWMRHLVLTHQAGFRHANSTVAELGPGDSLGTGLAALLSGASHYFAMDVYQYWDVQRNIRLFDALVDLFRQRARIPDETEYPKVHPTLTSYDFPHHILTEDLLAMSLNEDRIQQLRQELEQLNHAAQPHIRYFIPWNDAINVLPGTVDLFFSQAVLEYVDDLPRTYRKLNYWLKPDGWMSHCIDFSSHGMTQPWNAHWRFNAAQWKLAHGNYRINLNRATQSMHADLLNNHGFHITHESNLHKSNTYKVWDLHPDFQDIPPKDLDVYATYWIIRKRAETKQRFDR
jgi:hypothetical protein